MNAKPLHVPLEASNWLFQATWTRLDDVSDGIFDCPHTTPKLTDAGPFVVRSQDIRGRVFDMQSAGRVSEETYRERIARAEPRYGDLLYSREGTYFGIAAEVPRDQKVCLGQRMVLIRPNQAILESRFLLYWLNSPVMEAHLRGFRDGSVAERLNMATIRALAVPIIPLSEQREIASILGVLDDKIELNRRMAATLEEMARSLYRSWFVDFDPVHAKIEGRQPAFMDEETAALFPDRFGEDGLPEGWKNISFVDAIDIISGGTPKTSEPSYWEGDIPWYSVVDAPGPGQIFVIDTEKKITEKGLEKSPARLVPRGTTIISARGTVGKLAMTSRKMTFNQSCYGLRSRRVRGDAFCYFATEREVGDLQSRSHGSVFSTITRQTFEGVTLIDCADTILEAFADRVDVCLARICSLIEENQTLATLRDTLLPKLMSGEIRVGQAREQIEEVA